MEFLQQLLFDQPLRYKIVQLFLTEHAEELQDRVDVRAVALLPRRSSLLPRPLAALLLASARLRRASVVLVYHLILLVLHICQYQLVESLQSALLVLPEYLLAAITLCFASLSSSPSFLIFRGPSVRALSHVPDQLHPALQLSYNELTEHDEVVLSDVLLYLLYPVLKLLYLSAHLLALLDSFFDS